MRHDDFSNRPESWIALPLKEWRDTCDTLHMWTQVVGKLRLELCPLVNHWWEVPLYVSARGLTTSPIPYQNGIFEVEFDFQSHNLLITASAGGHIQLPLVACSVADFYAAVMDALRGLGIDVKIWTMPVEVPDPIAFEKDTQHASYNRDYANRFWRVLTVLDTVFKEFRGNFLGKNSPVHFFWGSFDLAVTRFSGRRAPTREGVDPITREAYSHEVISAGWWPGGGDIQDAAFYAYAAPEPESFARAPVRPGRAFYHPQLKEFLLMFEDVRQSPSPKHTLLEFLQSTYEAGANLAHWDRGELERTA